MDVITKQTRMHFSLALILSCAAAVLAHEWLIIIFVLWAALAMGGIARIGSQNQRLVSIQFGCLLGLSIALAIMFWGPMELFK